MKIAIVARNGDILPTPTTLTWAPGIVITNEARVLTKLGHNIRVYCAKGSKVDGDVVDFGMPPASETFATLDQPQKNIRNVYFNIVYQLKVIEHLRKNPVDIIHLHTYRDFPLYKEANLNIPIVVTIHNDFFRSFKLMPDFLRTLINEINIIAIGHIDQMPKGIKPPVAIVPNILDLQRFKFIAEPKNRIVFTGRLIPGKGPDLAIEAARLANIEIGLYGQLFGEEEWKDNLHELFKNSSHATYHGYLPHNEVNETFDAKALLLPIRDAEGFPSVVIEAMASGTPVIAFRMGGTKDLIKDGVNGFLVEPGNLEAMVEAIKRIGEIDRKKCREYVLNRFNELELGSKLVNVLQTVIDEFKEKAA